MFQEGRVSTPMARVERQPEFGIVRTAKPVSARVVCGLLLVADLVTLAGSGALAYAVHLADDAFSTWPDYAFVVGFGTLLAVNVFQVAGLYEPDILKHPRSSCLRLALGWFGVAAGLIAIGFLTKTSEDYSRGWALLWLGFGVIALLGTRWAFFLQASRWMAQGRLQRRIAIIGIKPLVDRLAAHIATHPTAGVRVAGIFTDASRRPPHQTQKYAFDGNLDDLVSRVRRDLIDTVIIAMPTAARRRLVRIQEKLRDVAVDIRLCPGPMAMELAGRGVSHYAGVPTFNLVNRPLADWRYAIKEVEDRLLGALILLLISPLMLAIAALIKFDSPGPVFFRQKRYGYNNQLIEVLKFRTMRQDQTDLSAEQLTQRNDPRITRIGAVLRRYSLDELPQFINVVWGDMAIVGPRPHALSAKAGGYLYHEAVDHYAARHRVKPGITGWAQINGWRGSTDTVRQIEKRVEYDLYYIENWSLWLDLKIIVLTVFKGFYGQNAY